MKDFSPFARPSPKTGLYFLSSDFEKRLVFKGELHQEKTGRYFNQNKGKMGQQ